MRRVTIIGAAVLTLLLPSLFLASPASAIGFLDLPVPPPEDEIVIDVVTINGSGCPAGTAAVAVSPDNRAFTVTYSQYLAQVGVGANPTDFRKNCQLNVAVHVPQGFTYAIAKADYRGFAALESGATATQRASYYFSGQTQQVFVTHPFRGPLIEDWLASDEVEVASLVYHPCGAMRNLNINTELRVSAGTSDPKKTTSFISMDSTDGSIQTVYHFSWAHCP